MARIKVRPPSDSLDLPACPIASDPLGVATQSQEEVLRAAEDEHEFTVRIGWQSEERARRYYAHPALRAGIERSGGIDGRGLTFLLPPG